MLIYFVLTKQYIYLFRHNECIIYIYYNWLRNNFFHNKKTDLSFGGLKLQKKIHYQNLIETSQSVKLTNWMKANGAKVCSFVTFGLTGGRGRGGGESYVCRILANSLPPRLQSRVIQNFKPKQSLEGNGERWAENHLTYRFDLLRPFSLLHLTTVEANRELLESQRKDRLLDSLSFCIPTRPISRISFELISKSRVFVPRETISVSTTRLYKPN